MTQRQYRQSPIIIAAVCVSGAAATVSVWRRIRRNSKKKAESRSSAAAAAAAAATGMEALLLSTTPVHKVYLFTFPPVPRVRNISPFSLKVESFLRLYDIPYEMVPTFTFSSKGQMPYIRLNSIDGMEIPDSNVIIDFRPPVVLRKVIASLLSARQVVLLSRRLCVTYLILLRVDLSVEHSEQWQNATCLNCYMYASYVVRLQAGTG